MGKIINTGKLESSLMSGVINVWFGQLPLYHDKDEAKYNHNLLCDILQNNPNMVYQGNQ